MKARERNDKKQVKARKNNEGHRAIDSTMCVDVVDDDDLGRGPDNSAIGNTGSVPTGTATNEVLHLTLRDAIDRAVRYNLGLIESGENARIARGQRLRALSALLPQVSASASENVEQFSASTLGIKIPQVPRVIGPFSFSEAQANASQTLFSYESIQRFRAASNAEQAAQLRYTDTLDVITLIVGNGCLQVIQAGSRVTAEEAQVNNAQALYDQAVEQLQAGTSPKIDVTRSGVQLHTEQYNLSTQIRKYGALPAKLQPRAACRGTIKYVTVIPF